MKAGSKLLIMAVVALVGTATSSPVWAGGGCYGPDCGGWGGKRPAYYTLTGFFHGGHPKPVFQAAPWYLYWPYDGHFLTPAPLSGPFYAPPAFSYGGANPYFPAPVMPPPVAAPQPMPGSPSPGSQK